MSYSVKTIPKFEKNLKKLCKKYPSIKLEFTELVKNLIEDPQQGTALGNNCFKIRMSIASKGKGKSGGARVITNFVVTTIPFTYLPFTTRQKRTVFPMLNSNFCCKIFLIECPLEFYQPSSGTFNLRD